MNDDTLHEKLKRIGDSIDSVRDEGRTRGERNAAAISEFNKDVKELHENVAKHEIRIEHVESGVKGNRELMWKILALLASAGLAIDKIFH